MKKFLVAFKENKRNLQIEAPNDARAKEWAEKQLEVWKAKYRYSIAEIVEKPVVAEKKTEPKAKK